PRNRSPKVQKALEAVTKLDSTLAQELFIENPLKVYQNELIEPKQPIEIIKKSFWKSLFSKKQR
ncbi:MAG: capsular biosynthesis protein, partial [Turicibacter sp.]|nr:capsular biosynthesis protein [Turicibacter sp.]